MSRMNVTIRQALVSAVLLGVLVPALLVGAYLTRLFYYDSLDREITQSLQHNADVLALGVRESLWAIDSESAAALAEAVMKDAPLVSVEVLDPQLGRFVFREEAERRVGKIYNIEREVLHRGTVIGRVRLEMSDEVFTSGFGAQLVSLAGALVLQLLFSACLILAVLHYRVGRPLKRLSHEAKQLAEGELSATIVPLCRDEIGEVEAQLEITRLALQNLFRTLEQKNRTLEVDLRERMRVESALRDREQRLRALVDQSPLAVIEFDLEWHILDWNEAAVRIFGWHREEVLGRSVSMLNSRHNDTALQPSDDEDVPSAPLDKQKNSRADGNTIVCQWYNNTIRDSKGKAQRIVAVVEDITERQHADDEIRRLATVVRMTTNLVVLTDSIGSIIWFNRAFAERSLAPGTNPIGSELPDLLGGGNADAVTRLAAISQAFASEQTQSIAELPCRSPSGKAYWVAIDLQPIRDEQGKLQQWVVVMTDVTNRHTISDALHNIARISAAHDPRLFLEQIQSIVARGAGACGAYVALHDEVSIDVCCTWGTSTTNLLIGSYPKDKTIASAIESASSQIYVSHAKQHQDDDIILRSVLAYETLVAEPILDPQHNVVGHLALFFSAPPGNLEEVQSLAQIGASRAGAELSRQQTLEALQDSELRFSSIFQSSPIPLALFRRTDGHCVNRNPSFRSAFGDIEAHLETSPALNGGQDFRAWLATMLDENKDNASADLRLVATTGEPRDCQLYARKISLNDEECQLIAIVDITQLQDAQRQVKELNFSLEQRVKDRTRDLANANAELEKTLDHLRRTLEELVRSEKLAALGSLVAGIAHELNTPIGNSLIVATTLRDMNRDFRQKVSAGLRKSVLDEHVDETTYASDILIRNLQRAAELITSFKQVAVDQTSSQRREFDLAEVVNEIIVTMHPVFRKTSHTIETRIPAGISLDSYPGPLGQVITNLLNNAVLHAFDAQDEGLITLSAAVLDDGSITLSCHDNGCGISAANLKRIFDPFFTTKLGREGSGLGLNIVHNIVTGILGGTIHVESAEQAGATFTLTLPRKAPQA